MGIIFRLSRGLPGDMEGGASAAIWKKYDAPGLRTGAMSWAT